jgi:hypothetical protein
MGPGTGSLIAIGVGVAIAVSPLRNSKIVELFLLVTGGN